MKIKAANNLLLFARVLLHEHSRKVWGTYFRAQEYRSRYRDLSRWPYPAALHYVLFGNTDLRDPSARFDTRFYLWRHPDVAQRGINALVHYAAFGARENRMIPFLFYEEDEQAAAIVNQPWPDSQPLASAIVPFSKGRESVAESVESLLEQTFPRLEIVLVGDGSSDPATVAKARELEAMRGSRVRFFHRAELHGIADNRNFGIEHARGRYVCCLEPGDRLDPIYAEVTVFLEEVFGVGLVYASGRCLDAGDVLSRSKETSPAQILDQNDVSGPALYRREDWEKAGKYRDLGAGEQFFLGDWDFWIRLLSLGRSSRAIEEPLFEFRVPAGEQAGASLSIPEDQRRRLQEVNSALRDEGVRAPRPQRVQQPFGNLIEPVANPGMMFALPYLTFGGAEMLFRQIAEWAKDARWNPIVVTTGELPKDMPAYDSCFKTVTNRVYPLATLFRSNTERVTFLEYLIRRYDVRAMMLGGAEAMYHWLPTLKVIRPDLRVADHLFNSEAHVHNNRFYREQIDATVFQSAYVERQVGDAAGAICRIPLGVEIPEMAKHEPGESIVIGYFGRLSPEKGPDLFVEIADYLYQTKRSFRFLLAGDGPERSAIERLIRARGLSSVIEMTGHVSPVQMWMKRVDLVIVPSRLDGMPASVLEAQALGIPVVASSVGGIPEIVRDGETGYLCKAGDVQAFCARIVELAEDRGKRTRMGQRARQSVEQLYSIDRMRRRYHELFEKIRTAADSGNR